MKHLQNDMAAFCLGTGPFLPGDYKNAGRLSISGGGSSSLGPLMPLRIVPELRFSSDSYGASVSTRQSADLPLPLSKAGRCSCKLMR